MNVMNKRINILLCLAGFILTMSSCEMETSSNGLLDGFWHLEQVDTLATGGISDYRDKKVFWGVQYKLLSVSDHDKFYDWHGYYFRFSQTGDSLILSTPYRNKWHQNYGGDIPVEEMNDTLRHCGFNALEEHFLKEQLSGNKMVLRNKTLRLKFTKF